MKALKSKPANSIATRKVANCAAFVPGMREEPLVLPVLLKRRHSGELRVLFLRTVALIWHVREGQEHARGQSAVSIPTRYRPQSMLADAISFLSRALRELRNMVIPQTVLDLRQISPFRT